MSAILGPSLNALVHFTNSLQASQGLRTVSNHGANHAILSRTKELVALHHILQLCMLTQARYLAEHMSSLITTRDNNNSTLYIQMMPRPS